MAETTVTQAPGASTQSTGRRSRLFVFGLTIMAIAVGAVSFWAYKEIESAEQKLEDGLRLRASLIVDGRVDAIDTQLKNMMGAASRLIESEVFSFFAAEVDQLPGDVSMLIAPPSTRPMSEEPATESSDPMEKLSEQLPLMIVNLRDFVLREGFVSARIVNRRADTYISTHSTPPALTTAEEAEVKRVLESGQPLVTGIYAGPFGLVHGLIMPIFPPEFDAQHDKAVSALMLVKAITGKNNLSEIVTASSVSAEGFITRLLQSTPEGFQEVGLGVGASLRPIASPESIDADVLPFGVRSAADGSGQVYSMGRRIPGTAWWITQERDYANSRVDYTATVRSILTLAALGIVALGLLVSVIWWRLVGKEQQEVASQLRDLNELINEQKVLLDGINSTMTDPVALTDDKGVYHYVNRAFAEAVGRSTEEIPGLDIAAVFGFDTAKRLEATNQRVLLTGESTTVDEIIWLQSKRHHFQISIAPLRGENGVISGIVSVFRDITKQVEAQERGNRMVQQTIEALVRAIEAVDPFLGGHSRIMGRIASLIARTMSLPEREVSTIETAASLSQVGKMFVPREVVTKPGALTPEEKRQMEQHVEYSRDALKDIEFELPVLEAVTQMNERLDGKGYPAHLKGDEIGMAARILAVANAFTAMARPRSYRPAMPVAQAVSILAKEQEAYDPQVVRALEAVLKTPSGERIVAQAAASRAE
ncbi:PAS domain-containing protein [Desulfovibrio sp. OttesenSCG-928-I05]|nr:PAS domain-containing protein [Desulfovibrio sp. OttesenSCG-928-I05]